METVLFFFLLIAFVVGVVTTLWLHKEIKTLKKQHDVYEKQIAALEQKVESQARTIERLKVETPQGPSLPVAEVLGSLALFKSKGVFPGVLALGLTVFQAYWKNKKGQTTTNSLPLRKK